MGIRTQAPIRHQHIPCLQARMDRLHLSQVMREEGRDDQLQEHPRARMEEPQQPGDGNAAPGALHCRLAERVLSRRGIRHRAARPIDQTGAIAGPLPFIKGEHRGAEACQQESKEVEGKFRASLTVGRRAEPYARQMRQMAARGVAVQNL